MNICLDDERLTVESYSGILYPSSDTKVFRRRGHCLTYCSMNRSCAVGYSDEQNQLCYRSNVSAVYNISNADTGNGNNFPLAKRATVSNIDVLSVTITDNVAQGRSALLDSKWVVNTTHLQICMSGSSSLSDCDNIMQSMRVVLEKKEIVMSITSLQRSSSLNSSMRRMYSFTTTSAKLF